MHTEPVLLTFKEPRNLFQGFDSASLCSLAGRYDNPIPARFLAPIDCSKIPALKCFSVSTVAAIPLVPESPRWLMTQGKFTRYGLVEGSKDLWDKTTRHFFLG